MARRRNLGAAMAGSTQLLMQLLQQQQQQQRFDAEQKRASETAARQSEQTQWGAISPIVEKVRSGEARPEAVSPEGRALAGKMGINFDALIPSQDQLGGKVRSLFEGSKTLAELPTREDVLGRMDTVGLDRTNVLTKGPYQPEGAGLNQEGGPTLASNEWKQDHPRVVKDILGAFEAKVGQVESNQPLTEHEFFDDAENRKRTQFLTQGQLQQGVGNRPQEPTPLQAGANQGTTTREAFRTGEGSPEMLLAKVQAANQLEAGTRPGVVARAGAEAGARSQAQFNVEYSPQAISKKVELASKIAAAEAVKAQDTNRLKAITDLQGNMAPIMITYSQIKQVTPTYPFAPTATNWTRARNWAEARTQANSTGSQLDGLAVSGMIQLASMMNGGRPTEPDAQAMAVYFPLSSDTKDQAAIKEQNLANILELMPLLVGGLPPGTPVAAQLAVAESLLQRKKNSIVGNPAPPGAAPQPEISDPNWGR